MDIAPSDDFIIRMQGVDKYLGTFRALDDINLNMRRRKRIVPAASTKSSITRRAISSSTASRSDRTPRSSTIGGTGKLHASADEGVWHGECRCRDPSA